MPLIEVKDDQYLFLKNLQQEIKTQDNRGTAMPYFFQTKTYREVYGESLNDPDIRGYVSKNGDGFYEEIPQDENEDDYEPLECKKVIVYDNCFLTEKACLKHIEENKHHYADEPAMRLTYLNSAWRNAEMEKLFEFILSIKL